MDSYSSIFLMNNILSDLEDPTLLLDNLENDINFIQNELLEHLNDDIIGVLNYFRNMIPEIRNTINKNNNKIDGIIDLITLCSNYLTITNDNKNILNSNYTMSKYIIKAFIHQIIQLLYYYNNNSILTYQNLDSAFKLYDEFIIDTICKTTNCKVVNFDTGVVTP